MKHFAIIAVIVTLIIGIGVALGIPFAVSASASDRAEFAVTLASSMVQFASAYLFLYAIRSFKPVLRKSYILIVIGIGMLAFVQLGLPVATLFHLYNFWPLLILVLLFFFCSGIFMYMGIRKYALLVEVRNKSTYWRWVIGFAVILAVLLTVIFHEAPLPQILACSLAFNAASVMMAWRIRQQLGSVYTDAINKLIMSITAIIIFDLHMAIAQAFWPDGKGWYFTFGIHYWPQVLWAVTSLLAGQAFLRTVYYPQTLQENADFIDSIMYTAALASNVQAIDPILDQLRILTAKKKPEDFTDQDRKALLAIYRQIEDYLVTSDPLRTYPREELRSHLAYDFQSALKSTT